MCKKAARQLNALARISKHLDIDSRKIIYQSFVASNFNYCPLVWHFCGKLNSAKTEKIQERALKIIYKDYNSSYNELLSNSGTSSLLMYRIRLIIIEVYKCIRNLNPQIINEVFEIKPSTYSFRNEFKLEQRKKRTTTYGLRSFGYVGAKLWNDTSHHIDLSTFINRDNEIGSLKAYLKKLEIKLDPNFSYV